MFGLCQIVNFITYLQSKLSANHFAILWQTMLYIVGAIFAVAVGVLTLSGTIDNVIGIAFYSPSCLALEAAKGPCGRLSITHGGGFALSL